MRSDVGLDLVVDLSCVHAPGEDRLRDNKPGNGGDGLLIGLVITKPCIEEPRELSVKDGRAGAQGRQQGQHHANGGVKFRELLIIVEGEVEVRGLQVCPSMSTAVEDAVVGGVHFVVIVVPQSGFSVGIHPRVRGRRQKHGIPPLKNAVDPRNVFSKGAGEFREIAFRTGRLHLDHVNDELVRPGDNPIFEVASVFTEFCFQQLIGDGLHVERVAIDDHVL